MSAKEIVKEILSTLIWFVLALVLVLGIRYFLFEPFQVDGRSMEYTLHDGERMMMLKQNTIDRFDVVVFEAPDRPGVPQAPAQEEAGNPISQAFKTLLGRSGQKNLYIKRVIGLPGDSVKIQNDQLILNGQAMDEPYLAEKIAENTELAPFTQDYDMEAETGEVVVPEGKLLVMGDNRRNSLDGRSFGFIDKEAIEGEADFVHWPISQLRILTKYRLNDSGDAIIKR